MQSGRGGTLAFVGSSGIALAETVRLASNSRTSTVKLHVRSADDLASREPDPASLFRQAARRNVRLLSELREDLDSYGLLDGDWYRRSVDVVLGDAAGTPPAAHDLLVTSPPYGDNATTIAYGQYAYLPLGWIDLPDVAPEASAEQLRGVLENTHAIDRQCLGGSRKGAADAVDALAERSVAFGRLQDLLTTEPVDRLNRVAAFFRDMDATLDPILASLRPGAAMIWVTGNRSVGGHRVPLDDILSELLAVRGCREVARLGRRIPSKRMAVRNSTSETMTRESILVLRTPGA